MNSRFVAITVAFGLTLVLLASVSFGGSPVQKPMVPLDITLMAFKEQGVWYDLCEAPAFLVRIPPYYATFGPPPSYCPPPLCGPPMPPRIVK